MNTEALTETIILDFPEYSIEDMLFDRLCDLLSDPEPTLLGMRQIELLEEYFGEDHVEVIEALPEKHTTAPAA